MDLPFEYPNKNIQNQTIAHGLNFIPVRLFRSGNSKFQRQAKRVVITTGGVVNQHIFLIFIKELQKRQYENIFFDFIGIPEHHPGNINNFEFHQMGRQFDNLVANCDTVISSAGTTMWDLIANQKPIGLISVAENQESNFAFAVASGAAVRVLDSNNTKPDLDGLNSLFFDEDVRLNLINKERVDLDFLGASRVCELIMRKMRERKAFDTSF
jgi:spore coat polysaccharide biosynthesis predicted glycosyltransferase SpsG